MDKQKAPNREKNTEKAALVQQTAVITGVSKRYVRYVLAGERENENVLSTYMELLEGTSRLVQAVKEMIPFD